MNEEDFACSSFAPQRWRKDVCRKCYQPLRLHEKKKDHSDPVTKPSRTSSQSPAVKNPSTTSDVKPSVKHKPPVPKRNKDTVQPTVQSEVRHGSSQTVPPPPVSQLPELSRPPVATQPASQSVTIETEPAAASHTITKEQSEHKEPTDHTKTTPKELPSDENQTTPSSDETFSKTADSQSTALGTRRPSRGGPPPRPPPRSSSVSDSKKLTQAKTKEKVNEPLQSETAPKKLSTSASESPVDSSSRLTQSAPPPSVSDSTQEKTKEKENEPLKSETAPSTSVFESPVDSCPTQSAPPPSVSDSTKLTQEKENEPLQSETAPSTSVSPQDVSPVDSSSRPSRSAPPRPPPRSASTVLQTVKLDQKNESATKDQEIEQPLSSMAALSALLGDDNGEGVNEEMDKEQGVGVEQMATLLAEEESVLATQTMQLEAATDQVFHEDAGDPPSVASPDPPRVASPDPPSVASPDPPRVASPDPPSVASPNPPSVASPDPPRVASPDDANVPSGAAPPPPPPPLPPIVPPSPALSFQVGRRRARSIDDNPAPNEVEENIDEVGNHQNHESSSAHQVAMDLIAGGVSLRHVSPPAERKVVEEAVVDVASELRMKMQKQKKKTVEAHSDKLEELRPQLNKLWKDLTSCSLPTYLHILVDLLERVHSFIENCGVPIELLVNKLNWPSKLVDDLQEVVSSMAKLEEKVVMAENVCQQAIESEQLNVEVVHQCVMQVITTATLINRSRDQDSRYTRASSSFPVDQIDIHRLVQRATAAVTPPLDKMYKKALQAHHLVGDPTVSKYDQTFRLQNAVRLLRMCCNMSDSLSNSLEIPRHPQYSEAMLKAADLNTAYQKQIAILEKRGEWDPEESVNLQSVNSSKRSSLSLKNQENVPQMIISMLSEGGTVDDAVQAVSMTKEVFLHEEVQLIKSVIACDGTKMIDQMMQIRKMYCGDDESLLHRHDFDWLYEALIKSRPECIENLVKVHNVSIDCCSPDAGNSVLHIASRRQDWSMMLFIVKLGANPLLMNSSSRTPLEMLGIKCFSQQHFHELKPKELPFDLESYINNPSLSDVVLVSNEGDRFYGHRLMLCGQSPVFHSMMESEVWKNTQTQVDGEVTLSSVNSCTLRLLLQYLYAGRSTFPQEDLNTWIDLLAASTEFLLDPLKLQCEKVLSAQIDNEVVLPLYYAAERFSANKLLINCCHHLLMNYKHISDEGNEALKHLLENGETFAPK